MMHLILLPHTPTLFATSLMQTAGPKMATLTVVFFVTFKSRLLTNKLKTAM